MALDMNGLVVSNPSGTLLKIGDLQTIDPGLVSPVYPPAQWIPAFCGVAVGVGANSVSPQPVTSIQINNRINNSSGWNNTTFTCPVAGVYVTNMSVISNGGANATPGTVVSNYGGPLKNGVLQPFWYTATNDHWDTVNHTVLIYCDVGDQITFAVNTAPLQIGSGAGVYAAEHNCYSIWYLG